MTEKSQIHSEESDNNPEQPTAPELTDVLIVGAGMAGLSAAHYLLKQGKTVHIIESSHKVGGRVSTEKKEGYLLDRGFQVFLPMYPEARAILDFEPLDLKPFLPGAKLLLANGIQASIGDPLRDPKMLSSILFKTPIPYFDFWKLFQLSKKLKNSTTREIFERSDDSTMHALIHEYKFSKSMITNFLQPFFAGIFLEDKLETNRKMFDFVLKMFSEGQACIPNLGMQAIPDQLAEKIGLDRITLNEEVIAINGGIVACKSGKTFEAKTVLLASQANAIAKHYFTNIKQSFSTTCHFHYTTNELPFPEKVIALNTNESKMVNNICVVSQIAPGYSNGQEHLISLTIIDEKGLSNPELDQKIRTELSQWFGKAVENWNLLDVKKISYALPDQKEVKNNFTSEDIQLSDQLFICGDHLLNGSMNAAIKSGRLAAKALVKHLK